MVAESLERRTLLSLAPVVWVDPGFNDHTPGWGYDHFATIQTGIDAVATDGKVRVAAGSYVENLVVNKPLHLLGKGASSTLLYPAISDVGLPDPDAAPSFRGSQMIVVAANNVEIAGLKLDGDNPSLLSGVSRGGADIDARNGIIEADGLFSNLDVHNVTVQNIYLRGIYASNPTAVGGFHFHHNTVINVQGGPGSIAIFNWGGGGVIEDNFVSGANDAIAANWSTGTQFLDNVVTNSASGIHTDNNGGLGGVGDVIRDNKVSDGSMPGGSYGVWAFAPYVNVAIKHNRMTNVDVGLAAFGQNAAGAKVIFEHNSVDLAGRPGSVGAFVSTNLSGFGSANVNTLFVDNKIGHGNTGIYMEQEPGYLASAVIAGNSIFDNVVGIDIEGGTASIWGNRISHNSTGIGITSGTVVILFNSIKDNNLGILVAQSSDPNPPATSVTAMFNSITGNTTAGLKNDQQVLVDATFNWWGSRTGPKAAGNPLGKGDVVLGNVKYNPWLRAACFADWLD